MEFEKRVQDKDFQFDRHIHFDQARFPIGYYHILTKTNHTKISLRTFL